jgi:haloalkane dehalogenase
MTNEGISERLPYDSKFVNVYGSKMHYLEQGTGDTILFLHGIPTSCYIWRNIIPYLAELGHCVAPDLPGFGHSDKPDIDYTVFDHIKYINQFIDTLKLQNITLVMHGWGSVIGLHYAMNHPEKCKGLVFYEAFLRSLKGEEVSLPFQEQLIELKTMSENEKSGAALIDRIIPQQVMRPLTEVEMDCYRQPFLENNSNKPILQNLRELLVDKEKEKINELIMDYSRKLSHSSLPKLMLYSIPGFITNMTTLMWAKDNLSNLELIEIGEELHLAQEGNPRIMGEAISAWLQAIEQVKLS